VKTQFVSLKEVQPAIIECYAHTKEGSPEESVIEHTELCQKYFIRLVEQKGIAELFVKFEELYFTDFSQAAIELFEMMLVNIISFHDVGKMNPLFQIKKMGHCWKTNIIPEDKNIGSKHSIISSLVYLQYFLPKVNQLPEKHEKEILKDFAYIHSYIIARHHGGLNEFWKYLIGFLQDEPDNKGWRAKEWLENWEREVNHNEEPLKLIRRLGYIENRLNETEAEQKRFLFIYVRLLHSLLVVADYYATSEYMNGIETKKFGEISEFEEIYRIYQNTEVMKRIRRYEKDVYPMGKQHLEKQKDINVLRTEIFLEAEKSLQRNIGQFIYYLEAPTGSGKSNTAINLSLQLLQEDKRLKKIFYIYPFNTLIEQNIASLSKVFGHREEIMAQFAVVNSLEPMKEQEKDEELSEQQIYQKTLLDRQFLNYPIILSTHIALFNTMFGQNKENLFGFHQLCNSVIILDEIQSYKNEIWSEIIRFFKSYARLLNIKVIIMSATLPNLELLTDYQAGAVPLILDRNKYFNHPLFCNRVAVNYDLLQKKITLEILADHVCRQAGSGKKILIEFIRKKSAYEFHDIIFASAPDEIKVLLMTGDSSVLERKEVIQKVENLDSVILVATQVVEAGVDIDMDIGYKNISKLDSEEQFMGRINRSCKKDGIVYFFDLDPLGGIYKGDLRSEREYTLMNETMREILLSKNYDLYYKSILAGLKNRGNLWNENNIDQFFCETVGKLNFPEVERRMQLIENRQMISIYLARCIETVDGEMIDGRKLWEEYVELLQNCEMQYAEKAVKLFRIRSLMNGFIYELNRGRQFPYTDQIGDIFYIEDGEEYFENGILNRKKLGEQDELFI